MGHTFVPDFYSQRHALQNFSLLYPLTLINLRHGPCERSQGTRTGGVHRVHSSLLQIYQALFKIKPMLCTTATRNDAAHTRITAECIAVQKRTNVTYRDDNRRSPGNDGRKRSEGEAQTLRVEYKRKSVLTRNTVALSASPLLPRAMFQIVLQAPDRSPSQSDFLAVIASLRQLL